ncbi:hypothetical protein BJ875DRAFT_484521 [Amylocarpus encephaloides]|uniref:Uncharacterized protein n=1 Tax=Amylocarpus encephaloides TaxID=45428 RepID=A0A9P7YJ23_9HELO|nr:hypothetical protein BJ875DRAFT_484521 [Amylocarpus encephaloides]
MSPRSRRNAKKREALRKQEGGGSTDVQSSSSKEGSSSKGAQSGAAEEGMETPSPPLMEMWASSRHTGATPNKPFTFNPGLSAPTSPSFIPPPTNKNLPSDTAPRPTTPPTSKVEAPKVEPTEVETPKGTIPTSKVKAPKGATPTSKVQTSKGTTPTSKAVETSKVTTPKSTTPPTLEELVVTVATQGTKFNKIKFMLEKSYDTIKSQQEELAQIGANESIITKLRAEIQTLVHQLEINAKSVNEDRTLLDNSKALISRLYMATSQLALLQVENERLRVKVANLEADVKQLRDVDVPSREADVQRYKDKATRVILKYNSKVEEAADSSVLGGYLGSQISLLSDMVEAKVKNKEEVVETTKGSVAGSGGESRMDAPQIVVVDQQAITDQQATYEQAIADQQTITALKIENETLLREKGGLGIRNETLKRDTKSLEKERDSFKINLLKTTKEKDEKDAYFNESREILLGHVATSAISDALKTELGGRGALKKINSNIAAAPASLSKELKEKKALVKVLQDRAETAETSLEEETHQKLMLVDQIDDMRHETGRFDLSPNATEDEQLVPIRKPSLGDELEVSEPDDDEATSVVPEEQEEETGSTPPPQASGVVVTWLGCENLVWCQLQALVDVHRLIVFLLVAIMSSLIVLRSPRRFYTHIRSQFATSTALVVRRTQASTPPSTIPSLWIQIFKPLRFPRPAIRSTLANLIIQIVCLVYISKAVVAIRERDLWLAANDLTRRMVIDYRQRQCPCPGLFATGGALEDVGRILRMLMLKAGYEVVPYRMPG